MEGQLVVNGQSPVLLTQTRYLIGRGDGCEMLLPEDDGGISRRHALLERDPQGVWSIVDLGSRNGTLVNGERLTDRHSLSDGDRISVGQSQITLALPRCQPTIAGETPELPQSARANSTMAVEFPDVAPLAFPDHESAFVPPSAQPSCTPPVLAADVPKPTHPDAVPLQPMPMDHKPLPQSFEAPQHTDEPPRFVYNLPPPLLEPNSVPVATHSYPTADIRPAAPGSSGMGLVVSGVLLIVVCLAAYLAYIEPKMAEYQSVGGQLAGGLMSLFGNNSYYQQFETLYYERIACIVGGFVGAGLVLVGVMKRRL